MIQIVAIEKCDEGFRVTDAKKRIHTCKSSEELWRTLETIASDTTIPTVHTEAAPRRRKRFSRRTTREQEEDLRKVGQAIVSTMPQAAPAFNLARDMLQQLGTLGRKR